MNCSSMLRPMSDMNDAFDVGQFCCNSRPNTGVSCCPQYHNMRAQDRVLFDGSQQRISHVDHHFQETKILRFDAYHFRFAKGVCFLLIDRFVWLEFVR